MQVGLEQRIDFGVCKSTEIEVEILLFLNMLDHVEVGHPFALHHLFLNPVQHTVAACQVPQPRLTQVSLRFFILLNENRHHCIAQQAVAQLYPDRMLEAG